MSDEGNKVVFTHSKGNSRLGYNLQKVWEVLQDAGGEGKYDLIRPPLIWLNINNTKNNTKILYICKKSIYYHDVEKNTRIFGKERKANSYR